MSDWIYSAGRLPDKDGLYLVAFEKDGIKNDYDFGLIEFSVKHKQWGWYDAFMEKYVSFTGNVMFWLPIPKIPIEKEK